MVSSVLFLDDPILCGDTPTSNLKQAPPLLRGFSQVVEELLGGLEEFLGSAVGDGCVDLVARGDAQTAVGLGQQSQ